MCVNGDEGKHDIRRCTGVEMVFISRRNCSCRGSKSVGRDSALRDEMFGYDCWSRSELRDSRLMELEMIEEATHHQRNWANWYA